MVRKTEIPQRVEDVDDYAATITDPEAIETAILKAEQNTSRVAWLTLISIGGLGAILGLAVLHHPVGAILGAGPGVVIGGMLSAKTTEGYAQRATELRQIRAAIHQRRAELGLTDPED